MREAAFFLRGEPADVATDAPSVDQWRAFRQGAKLVGPLLLGVFPFAAITGAAAMRLGFTEVQAMSMSLLVFAGAAQLAMLDLLSQDAPFAIIVLTACVVNARFVIYSAALAPHFQKISPWTKVVGCYLVTDQAYACALMPSEEKLIGPGDRIWLFFGAGVMLWLTWQAGSALGVFWGAEVTARLPLDFAVPLSFIALLLPSLKDWPAAAAAATAAMAAVGFRGLPLSAGFLVAVLAGIGAGVWAERSR